jgi:hypothetical protein
MGFPWEREWESELDGNGNDSTGMGIGQFPLKGKKILITHAEYYNVSLCFVTHHKLEAHLFVNLKHCSKTHRASLANSQ